MKKGIDISVYQGNIDFNKVKNSGIEFVIIRAGYSQTIDKKFYENAEKCQKANLPVMGVYLFSYALNAAQAKAEAKFTVDAVKKAGLGKDTIIFFDFEYDSLDYAKRNNITIKKAEVMEFTKTFCEEVEASGYRAGIYYNNDFYNRFYDLSLLDKYVKWMADWDDPLNHPCDIHQYSCKGSVPGIIGDVDMNYDRREQKDETIQNGSGNPKKTIDELAQEVLAGLWGNGDERKKRITDAGYDYDAVQKRVNELLASETKPEPIKKTIDELANEVIDGLWGNGDTRKKRLTEAGYDYDAVQKRVNEIIYGKVQTPSKSLDEIAREVIAGKWGNGEERKKKLTDAGYDYDTVQKRVNEMLKKK